MKSEFRSRLTALVASLSLAACQSADQVNVRSTWGGEISQFGIMPLYPARENVYVGDIYLVVNNPCPGKTTNQFQSALLGTIPEKDMEDAFTAFYGSRPELPSSETGKSGTSDQTAGQKNKTDTSQGATGTTAPPASQANNSNNPAPQTNTTSAPAHATSMTTIAPKAGNASKPTHSANTTAPAPPANAANKPPVQASTANKPVTPANSTSTATASKTTSTTITLADGTKVQIDQGTPTASDNQKSNNQNPNATPTIQGTALAQPVASDSDPIFWDKAPPRAFNRLRLAAFPEMKFGKVADYQLGGGGPFAGLASLAGGIGQHKDLEVDVTVSGVEEAEIPAPAFNSAVKTFLASSPRSVPLDPDEIDFLTKRLEANMLQQEKCQNIVLLDPTIIFVSRVFYARSFDFSFANSDVIAALLKAQISAPAPATTTTGSGSTTNATPTNTLTDGLAALAGSGAPSVGASMSIGSNGGLVLKQTYVRPLAFGIDSLVSYDYRTEIIPKLLVKPASATTGGTGTPTNARQISLPALSGLLQIADTTNGPTVATPALTPAQITAKDTCARYTDPKLNTECVKSCSDSDVTICRAWIYMTDNQTRKDCAWNIQDPQCRNLPGTTTLSVGDHSHDFDQ